MNHVLKISQTGLILLLSWAIGLYPLVYMLKDPTQIGLPTLKSAELMGQSLWWLAFYAHSIGGGIALLSGSGQFLASIRKKRPQVHRSLGQLYCLAILIPGGIGGLYLSLYASGGLAAKLGFLTLDLFWLYTTYQGYQEGTLQNWKRHQTWMVRSFALTWAAVTLRLWMPIFLGLFRLPFEISYPIIAWLCWVPNLLLVEAIFRMQKKKELVAD